MRKITTLFKKDPNDLSRVIDEINPENEWALTEGVATRKFDGTAAAIINGELYKRYDVKKGKQVPANAIPCQEPDAITGHWPHWVKCDRNNKEDKWFWEGFDNAGLHDLGGDTLLRDGTYELCGPKVQGNPEEFDKHVLVEHGTFLIHIPNDLINYKGLKFLLGSLPVEGIVFHHPDGRMCKIRKSDFGLKR